MKRRLTALALCSFVVAGAVLGRAVSIQLIGDPRLESLARRQFQSKVLIRPRRGAIVDRNGEPLAVNAETRSLAANPSKIQNKRTIAKLLSKATGISYGKILEKLQEKREFVWIKRHIPEEEFNQYKKWHLIAPDGDLVDGLWIVKESKRVYPHKELAGHVLGATNLDTEGLEGMELWQDHLLRGKIVSVAAIRDALGRPTFLDAVAAKDVKDGEQLTLTLDASLQFSVEQELRAAVRRHSARGGTAIVMDAVSGEILAMANEPSFDPNRKGTPADHRRNRAITDGYEPGSTLKSVLLAGALSKGWSLKDKIWGERGSFTVQGRRISEAESHERFEWLSLKKLIQVSSNVGAAKLAIKLGTDPYLGTLRAFGFGSRTGIGFPGEIPGKIPAVGKKGWQPLTLANVGFGQGILVTPIQMIRAYAVFANGGWLVEPTLVRAPANLGSRQPPRRILPERVAAAIVEALQSATEGEGTAVKARLEGYQVAGKTGTAQVVDSATGRYSRSRYVASFIGFAVGVEPRLVIFASIDEPKGVYYAAETAVPLFRSILTAVTNRFSLPAGGLAQQRQGKTPENSGRVLSDRIRWSLAKIAEAPSETNAKRELVWQGAGADGAYRWKMPALKGLTPREALQALQGHDFQVEIRGAGIVRAQSPEEGKLIAEGGTVRLSLGEL